MMQRRGWCPSLFDPMPSGDGLLVRVKPPRGMLSAGAVAALAEAASRYGNGTIDLTSRGNLQVRGLWPETVASFAADMIGCGLANSDVEFERRRNVMVSPLVGDDPFVAPEITAIADELEHGLTLEPCFSALPPKFGIVVDGGGTLPLDGVGADIRIRAADDGFALSIDDGECSVICNAEQAARNALRLARAFVALSETIPSQPHRMRGLVRAVGGIAVLRTAGLEGDGSERNPESKYVDARVNSGHDVDRGRHAPIDPVGFIRFFGRHHGAVGLGLPFGTIRSTMLTTLADLTTRFGDGMLRLTPWRAVLIAGVAEGDAPQLLASAANAGLIVDPDDPYRGIIACPGRPSCSSASVATRTDAAFLAGSGVVLPRTVHVSGCSKGCAHPRPADITLVGDNGRYGLVRDGSAGEPPQVGGLTIAEVVDLLEQEMAA